MLKHANVLPFVEPNHWWLVFSHQQFDCLELANAHQKNVLPEHVSVSIYNRRNFKGQTSDNMQ